MNNSLLFKRVIYGITAFRLERTCHYVLMFGTRQLSSRKLPTLTMFTKVGLWALGNLDPAYKLSLNFSRCFTFLAK